MSAEFRQRKPSEYARIFWRRKWVILLPAIATALAFAWAVRKLPDVYESTTLLTVRPPSISPSIVPQLSNEDLSVRINTIGQQVVSRTSLQPLIEKYGLYAVERNRGEAMDTIVERMRTRDISVRVNTSRNDVTNGFYLSYRGSDPRSTMAVTAELASKYTSAQAKDAANDANQTKEFLGGRLEQAKLELDEIDKQRLAYMIQNSEHLPSQGAALVGQLQGLREQQKTLITELGRLREQRSMIETQSSDFEKLRQQEIENISEEVGDPKRTLAYAELVKRKAELESLRQSLLTQYREKHPDVMAVESQIKSVEREMNAMVSEAKERIAEKRKKIESQIDPRLNTIKYNVKYIASEIARQEKQLALAESAIGGIERRLNGVPGTEVGLEAINREYLTKKAFYDDLLRKSQQADIVVGVQANAQGETIQVIDGANLPEQPIAPKRPVLMLLGLALGLGLGLGLAALFEVPRLLTIQTTEDAEHYTGLPVLVSLPNMFTPREERRLKLRRVGLAFAGLAAAVLSVPVLYAVLRLTRVLEMFAFKG